MKQPPLDSDTHELATKVLASARRQGWDPVEALYRHGLLSTPATDRDAQADAVQRVLVRMSTIRVADFMRRRFQGSLEQRTPQDLYNILLEWLEEYVSEVRKS